MPCSADTSCIQSYSVHSHTLLVWALFPYTRGQGPGWYCALLYISVWQVKNSTIVLSHGGHRALLLEKHYLYFRSEWFTMCSIWNLQHTSSHSEFPYHYNFSFHMFKQMLMNEFISVGSCTWLPPEDPQCSGFYVANNSQMGPTSFSEAAPAEVSVYTIYFVHVPITKISLPSLLRSVRKDNFWVLDFLARLLSVIWEIAFVIALWNLCCIMATYSWPVSFLDSTTIALRVLRLPLPSQPIQPVKKDCEMKTALLMLPPFFCLARTQPCALQNTTCRVSSVKHSVIWF